SVWRPHPLHEPGEFAMVMLVHPLVARLAQACRLEDADAAQHLLRAEQRELLPPKGERREVVEGGARRPVIARDGALVGAAEVRDPDAAGDRTLRPARQVVEQMPPAGENLHPRYQVLERGDAVPRLSRRLLLDVANIAGCL